MKYQSTLQSMDFASVGGHGMLLRLGGAVLSGGGSGAGGWAWLCGPRAGTMSFCSAVPPPSAELFVLTKEGKLDGKLCFGYSSVQFFFALLYFFFPFDLDSLPYTS
jgi:hypothetical protein